MSTAPRPPRKTVSLPLDAAQNLLDAHGFASARGTPLNRMWTTHWAHADGYLDPRLALARAQACARRFFERRGHELAMVWVMERGRSNSPNSHVLIHVPHGLGAEFERQLRSQWFVGGTPRFIDVRRADQNAIYYVLKDVETEHYSKLGIHRDYAGKRSLKPILGKRAGVSQNLGQAARARWQAALAGPDATQIVRQAA